MAQDRTANNRERRRQLRVLVAAMLLILALAFVFILLAGIMPAIKSGTRGPLAVPVGQTLVQNIEGQRVWISRISTTQQAALVSFPAHAVLTETGCPPDQPVCMVSAATSRTGVELRFLSAAPMGFDPQLPWVGGFIDPNNGAVYDLLGRAYRFQGPVEQLQIITR